MAQQNVQQVGKFSTGGLLSGLAVGALILLGVYLFFGDQLLFYFRGTTEFGHRAPRGADEVLAIGYTFEPHSLEPTHFDPVTRSHLVDVYQGLVMTNRDLKPEPGLAVSWGLLDPLTWEFRLRPDVKFHNGEVMTTDDVVYSLERALLYEDSQLQGLLDTIQSMEAAGTDRVRIRTRVPDPLLPQKLAVTYIFPSGFSAFEQPIGTGPYRFVSKVNGKTTLARHEQYWGRPPAFQNVELIVKANRRERLAALESGEIRLLANVPPSAGCSLMEDFRDAAACETISNGNIEMRSIPSLEVSFLIFDFDHPLFGVRAVREALNQAFDPQVFVDIAFGFAKPANQFVSSGVFGFNPEIAESEYGIDEARQKINQVIGTSFERVSVTFDYPESLQPVGEYVQLQLVQLGIDVELNPLSDLELQQKILRKQSDFYFMGWRSELGDASDFLQAVPHSGGLFNGVHYMNKKVDQLIEDSQENLQVEERLQQLQEVMRLLVEEDVLGVPLFESETIFAFHKDIQFEPRVDGYVFASEIS